MAAVADRQMDSENTTTTTTGNATANPQPNHHIVQHNRLYQSSSPSSSSPSSSSSLSHPAPWQPSPQAAPFYPTYPPFFAHPAATASPNPYFDPNQHFAQWAYQQMMFNAQAQAQAQAQFHQAQAAVVAAQAQLLAQPGTGSMSPPQQQLQHQQPPSDHFPRSTEPFQPYPRRLQQRQHSLSNQSPSSSSSSSQPENAFNNHYPVGAVPNPPYARADAAGSSSSLNSGSSGRSRKGSNASSPSTSTSNNNTTNNSNNVFHGRTVSSTSRSSTNSVERPPSVRSVSVSTTPTDARRPAKPSPLSQPVTNAAVATTVATVPSPSRNSFSTVRAESPPTPKSVVTFNSTTTNLQDSSAAAPSSHTVTHSPPRPTHAKRLSISKDDSQLGDPVPVPSASMVRSGGLKGRLRRALSFNATSTLESSSFDKQGEDEKHNKLNSRKTALANANKNNISASSSSSSSPLPPISSSSKDASRFAVALPDEDAPPSTPSQDSTQESTKSRPRRSLFNSKINASTDNISLSSTVSSASVMIRKLGSLSVGRLARKNSLMSITSLFKDKKGNNNNNNTNSAGSASQASVTHATAEIDRMGVDGLTPAAEIVRQHTLKVKKSEEAAAARKKAEEEVRERARQQQDGVTVWERGTTNKRGKRIGEYVYDEDDDNVADQYHSHHDAASDSGSDNDSDGTHGGHNHGHIGARDMERISRGWQDMDLDDDEDVTIRVNQHPQIHSQSSAINTQNSETMLPNTEQDDEAWAVGIRRSLERMKRPAKGILKNAEHTQETILQNPSTDATPVPPARHRSNSYNHGPTNEPGPLAKIPDSDPDHIDGLQHHREKSGANGDHHLPAFTFEDAHVPPRSSSPGNLSINSTGHGVFSLPINSSAPVLSTFASHSTNATTLRPKGSQKKLTFAANLSIYDTFSAAVYDRRSEPATCNRLTPALAQRIKEELNSYKMEEMEVHALSRGHTQFFV